MNKQLREDLAFILSHSLTLGFKVILRDYVPEGNAWFLLSTNEVFMNPKTFEDIKWELMLEEFYTELDAVFKICNLRLEFLGKKVRRGLEYTYALGKTGGLV